MDNLLARVALGYGYLEGIQDISDKTSLPLGVFCKSGNVASDYLRLVMQEPCRRLESLPPNDISKESPPMKLGSSEL